jgi:hypothetical protein
MKIIQTLDNHEPSESWRNLGILELSASSDTDSAINAWMTELLSPLSLSTDFLSRVMESVKGTVSRVLDPSAVSITEHGKVHLSIFAPPEFILDRKAWGFFHIERIENRGEVDDISDHAIDFYLYVEGQ